MRRISSHFRPDPTHIACVTVMGQGRDEQRAFFSRQHLPGLRSVVRAEVNLNQKDAAFLQNHIWFLETADGETEGFGGMRRKAMEMSKKHRVIAPALPGFGLELVKKPTCSVFQVKRLQWPLGRARLSPPETVRAGGRTLRSGRVRRSPLNLRAVFRHGSLPPTA
ncbi:hypothetical protein SKAU_G00365020 [Synaphobranchus kaupii]|uniref:Uncharacterized protein n=1 Tax=Synaphobranchus kaupii TaxID=118154 RepID=A0A9Q1EEX2_SYNKA|nr:hypothetical protein SKAU_G00365020 [Synaphobranchus kaupii]